MKCLVIVLLFLKVSHSTQLQEIYSYIGSAVILPCQNVLGNKVAQWLLKNTNPRDSSFITLSGGWHVYNSRLKIHGEIGSESYDLEIENVTSSDSGTYQCAIQDFNRTKYTQIMLFIQEKPNSTYLPEETTVNTKGNTQIQYNVSEEDGKPRLLKNGFKESTLITIPSVFGGIIVVTCIVVLVYVGKQNSVISGHHVLNYNEIQMNGHPVVTVPYSNVIPHTTAYSNVNGLPPLLETEETTFQNPGPDNIFNDAPYQLLSGERESISHEYMDIKGDHIPVNPSTLGIEEHIYHECSGIGQLTVYESLSKERNDTHMYS